MKANFTYEIVTTESADDGDFAEHGWIMPGIRWAYPLQDSDGYHEDTLDEARAGEFDLTDLSEIISFAQDLGISYDSGNWFSSEPTTEDYTTDEEYTYNLHFDGITPSSYRRIAKLLGINVDG